MLEDFGALSSIIGLSVSLLTAGYAVFINNRIKKIQQRILFNTRIEELNRNLQKQNSNLSKSLNNFEQNIRYIKTELAKSKATLENISGKISRHENKYIKEVIQVISILLKKPLKESKNWFSKNKPIVEEDIWKVYTSLSTITTTLENRIKDRKII